MRIRELGLLVLLAVLFIGGFAAGAKGAWGFSYEHDRRDRHYHHHRYCPYEDHYYRYHYQPYYGYGWREYQPPCPPRYPQRPPGYWDDFRRPRYYGFYYESR